MSEQVPPELAELRSSRVIVVALYLFGLAPIGRTLVQVLSSDDLRSQSGLIVGPELAFLLLFSFAHFSGVLWRARLHGPWLHLYFTVQCAMVMIAYVHAPGLDYITSLLILLSYQAAMFFSGRMPWIWIGVFVTLTVGPLVLFLGLLRGLGLGLVSLVGEIVIAAYIITNQEVVIAQARRQAMLLELQETNRQLELYAGQVEELASIQERNRLAREIHDSVSQTLFSITLNTRAAQLLLEKNPAGVRAQLEQLQSLVQSALAEMRSLIAQLRQTTES